MTSMVSMLSIAVTFALLQSSSEAQLGDNCQVRESGTSGICKLSTNCPIAQKQADHGIDPTVCGYQHVTLTPIVCCEGAQPDASDHHNDDNLPNESELPDIITFKDDSDPFAIAEAKCREYSELITEEVQVISLGEYAGVPLVVGGAPALEVEFPHMAAIGLRDAEGTIQWGCGGTLISNRYVLSAAHCAAQIIAPPVRVRLGITNLEKPQGTMQEFNIERIIKHPNYNLSQKYDDIVLFRLDRDVVFNRSVRPACLWTAFGTPSTTAIATGWGRTKYRGSTSKKLLKVALQIYSNSLCEQTYKTAETTGLARGIKQSMLCAGDLKGEKDTCKGDSGGPLQITKDDIPCVFYIVGITSFGQNCATPDTPAVYTRISSYVKWIVNTVW